jgi:hypothetical protein
MAARRGDNEQRVQGATRLADRLLPAAWRRIVVAPLMLLLFVLGAWLMWRRFGDQVLRHPTFQLDPSAIHFTPQPPWLLQDILPEVVRIGSLEAMQLQETSLTVQVASAFELHPWVRRVERVRKKYPAGVDVELTYRQPVGMVMVPEGKLQPVDGEGVALPGVGYITAEYAREFPRIFVGQSLPSGPLGAAWGDPLVADAAKLAQFLHGEWETLKDSLYQIQLAGPASPLTTTSMRPEFDILGRPELGREPGLLIHWGRAPGQELAGEPNAAGKLAEIKDWLQEARAAGVPPLGVIDLRSVRALTARRSNSRGSN